MNFNDEGNANIASTHARYSTDYRVYVLPENKMKTKIIFA